MNFDEIDDYSDEYLKGMGYCPIRVSVFDRWLTVAEASESDIINFNTAVSMGAINKYLIGERAFLGLYSKITSNYSNFLNCSGVQIEKSSKIFVDSLREKELMDIYVPSYDLRILGGYDRTDTFLFKVNQINNDLCGMILNSGLFILSGTFE